MRRKIKKINKYPLYDYERIKEDKKNIYLFMQFYISPNRERYEEVKFCLQKNLDNPYIEKIYLLNEKIYTDEELGVNKNDKIIQIDIGERLTYKRSFEFMKTLEESYCVLANSDIFLDESIKNVKVGVLDTKPIMQALLRYEYKKDKDLEELKTFNYPRMEPGAQDTWIINNKFIDKINLNLVNFSLGVGGCDNAVIHRIKTCGIEIYNEPFLIKTYHVHQNGYRIWENKLRIPPPYLFVKPIV